MTAAEALSALIATLEEMRRILPADRAAWDREPVVRLAVERLWIAAGNAADEYRRAAATDVGIEPWGELVGYRNLLAHALPGDLSPDRIWDDTTTDLERILEEARRAGSR